MLSAQPHPILRPRHTDNDHGTFQRDARVDEILLLVALWRYVYERVRSRICVGDELRIQRPLLTSS